MNLSLVRLMVLAAIGAMHSAIIGLTAAKAGLEAALAALDGQ